MKPIIVTNKLELDVLCDKCNQFLTVEIYNTVIYVTPCPRCLGNAYTDGRQKEEAVS